MATSFENLSVGDVIDGPGLGPPHLDDQTLITRMIAGWADPLGAVQRRLETRRIKPVRPGDRIRPAGLIRAKRVTEKSRYVLIDVMIRNQAGKTVATGEATVEFPRDLICP